MINCPHSWNNLPHRDGEQKEPIQETPPQPPFAVHIGKMVESYRKTYWVILENTAIRPKNASMLDDTGKMSPYFSENREHVVHTAKEWAEFLNVPAPEPCNCIMCKSRELKNVKKTHTEMERKIQG